MKQSRNHNQKHLLEQCSAVGKALSSSSRLQIIDILCLKECTVEQLAKSTSLSVANTSQHLQVLRQAGFVASRREGNFIVYRIAHRDIESLWHKVQDVAERQLAEIEKTASAFLTKRDDLELLDQDEVLRRASTGEILLLDVRPEEEYRQSHLRSATSIPLSELEKRFRELPRDKTIVAYCRDSYCVLSQEAVKFLREKGWEAYRLGDVKQTATVAGNAPQRS